MQENTRDQEGAQMMMGQVAAMMERHQAEQYQAFVDKFKAAKTTDDCYTPPEIYEAVADWVETEFPAYSRERFLRPFRPGGDYQGEEYPAGCAVVDNPPFSILSQIVQWYNAREIPFFLFAPTLTLMGHLRNQDVCAVLIGAPVTYENGAEVNTSFLTNMDKIHAVRIEAAFRETLVEVNDKLRKERTRQLPKYVYPDCVLQGKDYRLAVHGQTLRILRRDCAFIRHLDQMKAQGKEIFGGGLLLSERAAAERAAAERAAAERAAAERAAAERAAATKWQISDRERRIIESLGEEPPWT